MDGPRGHLSRRGLLGALSVTLSGALPRAAAAASDWVLYTSQNRTAPVALATLGRVLAEAPARTNNALKIELKTAGTLPIRATAVAAGVADGKVQLGDDTYFSIALPAGGMLRMPGLVLTDAELHDVLPIQQGFLQTAFAKRKLTLLGYYVTPPQMIFTSRKVASIDDLRNLVIRTTTPEQTEAVLRLGGLAVSMVASDVPAALDAASLHGVYGTAAGVARPWKDKLTYATSITPIRGDGVILASTAALAALPEVTRTAVTKLGADLATALAADLAADDKAAMAEVRGDGMLMVEPSAEDIIAATRRLTPFWEQLGSARGKDGADTLAAMRLVLGR